MLLVLIGILMAACKYFEIGGFGDMSWWWCAVPFAAAALYWEIADEVFHKKDIKEMQISQRRIKEQRQKLFESSTVCKREFKVIRAGIEEDTKKNL